MADSSHDFEVRLERACEEAEIDEQWSFVGNKSNQRWLWYAVDHETNTVLAMCLASARILFSKS